MNRHQRILITGGHGFLGPHVHKALIRHGATDIIAPTSKECDFRNTFSAYELFREVKPHVVIHMAAKVGGIFANQCAPGTFFYDNMMMGMNVLQAAHREKAKVVTVGTVCSYPKHCPVPFREESLWDGYPEETNAPYGEAKKALLVMSQAYRAQYGDNFVMLFPANLYGGGDSADLEKSHVIPAMACKFIKAKALREPKVTLWGDGTPTREFLYVTDAAEGIALAVEGYNRSEPVNLGTGQEISMLGLATKILHLTQYNGEIVWDKSKPNGQPRRCLDVSRAKEYFGFEAKTSFDDGLAATVAWYKNKLLNEPRW